jgi:hypothetical protein
MVFECIYMLYALYVIYGFQDIYIYIYKVKVPRNRPEDPEGK